MNVLHERVDEVKLFKVVEHFKRDLERVLHGTYLYDSKSKLSDAAKREVLIEVLVDFSESIS